MVAQERSAGRETEGRTLLLLTYANREVGGSVPIIVASCLIRHFSAATAAKSNIPLTKSPFDLDLLSEFTCDSTFRGCFQPTERVGIGGTRDITICRGNAG